MTDKTTMNNKQSEHEEIENSEVYFECNHIDEMGCFDKLIKGFKITPENAVTNDMKMRLISNPASAYGFTACICKNGKWEYMGFGHSGAASIVTGLLKQSARKDERIRELEIKLKHKKNSYKREKEVKELSISRWEEDVESYEKKLSQIVELTDKTENIYEVLKDMDFEKRSRFFIARTSNNTKNDLWEFKNFIFSFIQPIYEQHVKHLQQIKQIVQGE